MTQREPTKWEQRLDSAGENAYQHPQRTALKALGWLVAAIVVLSVTFGVLNWIGAWGGEAKRITSPQNVREQNTAIVEDWEALQAAGANVCTVGDPNRAEQDPTFTEDPALAYKAQYRRIRVDYNRRMGNLYEAQAVRNLPLPSNLRSYPESAPTLEQYVAENCGVK